MQVGEFQHFSFLIWRYELYQYELYPKASLTLVRHPMQLKRDLLLQSFDHFLHIDNLRTQDFQIFLTQLELISIFFLSLFHCYVSRVKVWWCKTNQKVVWSEWF